MINNNDGYYILGAPDQTLAPPTELIIEQSVGTPRNTGSIPDLRQSVIDILNQYGQMLIVQRMNMKIHCMFCWENKEGEPDPQCPYCLGRGYLSIFERRISRKTSALNEHRLQLLSETPPGDQLIDELYWYFDWTANIQAEDTIYEVTWKDAQQVTIDSLLYTYRVNYSYAYRGENGRIEYWQVTTRTRPVDEKLRDKNLKFVSNISLHIPDDGIVRYITAAQ